MKRFLAAAVVVCTFPAIGQAQVPLPSQIFGSCGQIRTGNEARQYGQFGIWLEYNVYTTRDVNLCPLTLSAEAHVPGVAYSGHSNVGMFAASANRQLPVPYAGWWESRGKHDFTIWLPTPAVVQPFTFPLPNTVASVYIEERRDDPELECDLLEGEWEDGKCAIPNCPLIVDTGRNGYRLTSVENGVRFDLNADGVAEQVAWTRREADDAFLALDRNGNGRIDSGAELFGNHTPASPLSPDVTTANGFEALKFVETAAYGPGQRNEVIDSRDAAFSRLVLWRDFNHNGISEPEELQSVGEAGLEAIATEYRNTRRVDKHGNQFRQRARVLWQDGHYDHIFDVWLRWRD